MYIHLLDKAYIGSQHESLKN